MLNTEKRRAVRIPDEMRVKLYAYTPQPLRSGSEAALLPASVSWQTGEPHAVVCH